MSIWSSINAGDPREVMALHNDGDAANYRGEGIPHVHVDIAVTSPQFHDLIRLALWQDETPVVDEDVLLTRDAARLLRDRLTTALGEQS